MKNFSFILITGIIVFQSCSDGTTTVAVTDSVTNKEAQAMVNAPDTAIHHGASTIDASSSAFAMKAANGGMMEVDLGRWAQEHAVSGKVKEFATMLVTDHSKANEELKTIASAKNISLPAMVEGDMKKHMDQMMTMKGAAFDKAYVTMMVDDHKNDIAEFGKASRELPDTELRNFAAKTLPVLEKHYAAIKTIKSKM